MTGRRTGVATRLKALNSEMIDFIVSWTWGWRQYRTRALLGVCAYISTGSKPSLNEYAPNSEMDNLIWVGIN